MKRISLASCFLLLATTFAILFTASACEDDDFPIYDVYPIIWRISIEDQNGNDLLNAETPGNVLADNITLDYNGYTYTITEPAYDYYMARWRGMQRRPTYTYTADKELGAIRYVLEIGEWPGDENADATCIFNWPEENITRQLHFTNVCKYSKSGEPKIKREYQIDGKSKDDSYIKLIINR